MQLRNLLMLATAVTLLGGCGEKIEPGNTGPASVPAVKAATQVVRQELHPQVYEAVGTVRARVSTTVSSKLMGAVKAYRVREGDMVKQGDVLVVLDERQVKAQFEQAAAGLAEARKAYAGAVSAQTAAEAEAERAFLEYRRNRTLLEGDAITAETFESVEARYKQSQAALAQTEAVVDAAQHRVEQAKAALEAANVVQKDSLVRAPFDAEVTAKLADVGDLASPGRPLLTLEKAGGFRVDLVVPETYIQAVNPGQNVAVRVPAIDEAPLAGTIDVVVPSGDQLSRSFVVQVTLEARDGLRSGMFARIALTVGESSSMRVPLSAVISQGQLNGVFVIDAAGLARFRLIRTGRFFDDAVEVIAGLTDGTRIVVEPPLQIANGSRVEAPE